MKNRSIKVEVLINFIVSIIFSAIGTNFIVFSGILILEKTNFYLYKSFVNKYNTDSEFMIYIVLVMFILFIAIMAVIFFKRMDRITNYIMEISNSVNEIKNGNLDIAITISSENELGSLAEDINEMAYSIKCLMEVERQWEKNKNNLITNISHDLRTPLTSVIGFIELLKNKNYKDKDEYEHYCNIAFNKSKELQQSINQLFEFTKITNEDIKVEKVNLCLNELLEQVAMGFIPAFKENKMEYRFIFEEGNVYAEVDPVLMVRVFQNIISNGIKYGSSGKYLDFNIKKADEKIMISFINYGQKIEDLDIEKLFERLYRVEKKSKREGTGLGLAIANKMIQLHNGELKVKSNDEKTEFIVLI